MNPKLLLYLALVLSGGLLGCSTNNQIATSSVYIVQPGDSASTIAKDHGLTIGQLQKFNYNAQLSNLKVGKSVYLAYQINLETAAYLSDNGQIDSAEQIVLSILKAHPRNLSALESLDKTYHEGIRYNLLDLIHNLKPEDAMKLNDSREIILSWERMQASYPLYAHLMDVFMEKRRIIWMDEYKVKSKPMPIQISKHRVPDKIKITKEASEYFFVQIFVDGVAGSYIMMSVPYGHNL